MGEMAEARINGEDCETCGVLLSGEAPGHPRQCRECDPENGTLSIFDTDVEPDDPSATGLYIVTLEVSVHDAQALLRKAVERYRIENAKDGPDAAEGQDDLIPDILGTEEEPDVGACLQMLLDRSDLLEGAEIESSASDFIDPESF